MDLHRPLILIASARITKNPDTNRASFAGGRIGFKKPLFIRFKQGTALAVYRVVVAATRIQSTDLQAVFRCERLVNGKKRKISKFFPISDPGA